jgi:multidrug transporter EmrE-like cation transporter
MALEAPPPEALPESLPLAAPATPPGLVVSLTLLVISVGFAVAGQLMLKSAMDNIGRIGAGEVAAAGETVARAAREPRLWAGLVLFGVSALFWLVVLSRVPLSLAYPFVGVSYVLVVAYSRFILHEHVPAARWLGVFVIAAGIAVIGLSLRPSPGA